MSTTDQYLEFNGSNTRYNIDGSFIANQYFTFFVVERLQANPGVNRTILGGGTASANQNLLFRFSSNGVNLDYYTNGFGSTVPAFTSAAAQPTRLYSVSQLTSNRSIFLNGSTIANDTNNTLLSSWAGAVIGYDPVDGARYYPGHVKDILFYTGQVTTYNRQRIEGYLAWKWGLQSNLPATHPFRAAAPVKDDNTFYPNQINGLELWLDAADVNTFTVSGVSSLAGWSDKGPYQKVTTVSSNMPIIAGGLNGFSSIRFISNNQNVIRSAFATGIGSGDFMMTAVWKPSTLSNTHVIAGIGELAGNINSFGIGWNPGSGTFNYFQYSGGEIGNAPPTTSGWKIQVGARFSSTMQHWLDGSFQNRLIAGNSTVSANSSNGIFVGAGSQFFASADLAEVLFYSGRVSPLDRQRIEGYLAWKWGLQSNLPAIHPFFSAPPMPPTVFSPSSFSSLQLWLDGADPLGTGIAPANGTTIRVWADKSGAGNNAISTTTIASSNPVYDSTTRSLYFGDTSTLLTNYSASLSNESVFFVMRMSTTTTRDSGIVGSATGARSFSFNTSAPTNSLGATSRNVAWGSVTSANTFSRNVVTMGTYQNVSTSHTVFLDGGRATGNTVSLSYTAGLTTTLNGNFFNIYEILAFNRTLSTEDRQTVEGYLAWKWGLQSNLPATHPYRNNNPGSV